MSIVGTQSVSMSDLMKLGPQALGAMAQGQTQSIAPSYMVIAALKALTDQQRGMGAQVPQGTVKDQVLAQAAPPAQAGIGGMQPPAQGFAGGGSVGTAAINEQIADYLRQWFGPGVDRLKEETRRGLAGRRRTADEFDYSNEGNNHKLPKGTEPTRFEPTERVGTEKGRASNPFEGELKPAAPPPPVDIAAKISAAASSRGLGSTGVNPAAKYGKLGTYAEPGPVATADQFKLDIPKNEQLLAAAQKFSKPDEARMKELRDAEERAGLAAFGRGMLSTKNGTGFGAVFGNAAADYVDTKEAKAEKRREYEDQREALATQLGIQVGAEAKADYLANSKWGAERADATNRQAIDLLRTKNEATRFGNADMLDREKMAMTERIAAQSAAIDRERNQMMAEANKIAAEARRDGSKALHEDRIQKLYLTAQEIAIKAAEMKFGKTDPMLAQSQQGAAREQAKQIMYEAELSKAISELNARLGRGSEAPTTNTGPVVRKAY